MKKKFIFGSLVLSTILILIGWHYLGPFLQSILILNDAKALSELAAKKDKEVGVAQVKLLPEPYSKDSADPDCAENYFKFRTFRSLPDRPKIDVDLYCSCLGANLKMLLRETNENSGDEVVIGRKINAVEKACESRHLTQN